MSNDSFSPVASLIIVCSSKLTVTFVCGLALIEANREARNSSLTTTGSTQLFNALFLKMSAKKLETTTLNPYPATAHAAC